LDYDGDIVPAVVPDQENRDFDELQSMRDGQVGPALERRTCRLCANTCGLFGLGGPASWMAPGRARGLRGRRAVIIA
jgi:hypothetical protein